MKMPRKTGKDDRTLKTIASWVFIPEAITKATSLIFCKNSSQQKARAIPIPAGNDSLKAAAKAILK